MKERTAASRTLSGGQYQYEGSRGDWGLIVVYEVRCTMYDVLYVSETVRQKGKINVTE